MYLEYHELLKKYKEAKSEFYEALEKGSKIALAVMPKSSQIKEVVVVGGNSSSDDKLIDYAENRAKLDDIINRSRNDMNILDYHLKKMALEMKDNGDIYDRIYYYKWIEHMSVYKFNKLIGYSVRQTYNLINEMKKVLYKWKIAQNCTKLDLYLNCENI